MSDRLFFDTNVLLDHLLDREPFADDAADLWSMAERHQLEGADNASRACHRQTVWQQPHGSSGGGSRTE